jgi:CheY-like chemotaxis protein
VRKAPWSFGGGKFAKRLSTRPKARVRARQRNEGIAPDVSRAMPLRMNIARAGTGDANLAESEGHAMRESDLQSAPWRTALRAPPVHTPARILVAEDDEGMHSAVVETLRNDGYQVSEASDGGRLLVALAREYQHVEETDLIDLLVSDVRMPVCTGVQILKQLRAASWSLPVILMTAFGDEATSMQARLLGAVLFNANQGPAVIRSSWPVRRGRDKYRRKPATD